MNEERARQGVEHLQSAAIEVISAVRAFLDVAEAVVRDPAAVAARASTLVDTARATAAPAAPSEGADDGAAARVTRIRVS